MMTIEKWLFWKKLWQRCHGKQEFTRFDYDPYRIILIIQGGDGRLRWEDKKIKNYAGDFDIYSPD